MNKLYFNGDFHWFCSCTTIFMVLFWFVFFLQPFDDFEACFYAAVGEFSSSRTEV